MAYFAMLSWCSMGIIFVQSRVKDKNYPKASKNHTNSLKKPLQLKNMKKFQFQQILSIISERYHKDDFPAFLSKLITKLLDWKYETNELTELYILLGQILSLLKNSPNLLVTMGEKLMLFLEKRGVNDVLSAYLENCIMEILTILSKFYNNSRRTVKFRTQVEIFIIKQKLLFFLNNLHANNFLEFLLILLNIILDKSITINTRIYFFDIFQVVLKSLQLGEIIDNYLLTIKTQLDIDLEEHKRKLDNSF